MNFLVIVNGGKNFLLKNTKVGFNGYMKKTKKGIRLGWWHSW
jgi:hypothetical protein